jgi:excisionase family DNA binding protein
MHARHLRKSSWWRFRVELEKAHTAEIERSNPLTVQELAVELDCSDDEVRALIRAGELKTVACGIRPGRVPQHELDAYRRRLAHRSNSR